MEFSELYTFDSPHTSTPRTLKLHSDCLTRTLQDVTFPDKGGGFGYRLNESIPHKNRFIIWRSHGENLELLESSLDEVLVNHALNVSFPGSSIVDCHISDFADYIECLVCTSNGGARLSFLKNCRPKAQLPDRSLQSATKCCSVFSTDPASCNFYQLKGLQPTLIKTAASHLCHRNGDALFLYCLSSGTILVARTAFRATEPMELFELQQTSVIQKWWSGITPFTKPDCDSLSSVVDMRLVESTHGEEFLVCICKDHRLRLWDLQHRSCVVTLDLLEFLPDCGFGVNTAATLRPLLAPGMFHRIRNYDFTPSCSTTVGILVYLSLSSASSLEPVPHMTIYDANQSMSCWYWLQLDINKSIRHERDSICVAHVQRVTPPTGQMNSLRDSVYGTGEISVLDFIPLQVSNPTLLKFDENITKDVLDAPFSDHSAIPFGLLQGVWWLVHRETTGQVNLDDSYSLCWSTTSYSHQNLIGLTAHCSAISPGSLVDSVLPEWRQLPPSYVQGYKQHVFDGVDLMDKTSKDELDEFLDHMFRPYGLSWFAIASALRSLRDSHSLSNRGDPFTPADNMHDLRSQVHRALTSKVFADLNQDEFATILRTFYTTAIDYHDYGLQPLGLFDLGHGAGLLQPDSSVYVPYAPGLIVVRRWGFSMLRPLERYEHLLWNTKHPEMPLSVSSDSVQPTDLINIPSTARVDQTMTELVNRVHLLLQHLRQQTSWMKWQSVLYDLDVSSIHDMCINTLVTCILEELGEHHGSLESPRFNANHNDWKRVVFSHVDDVTYLLALNKLAKLLEGGVPCVASFDLTDTTSPLVCDQGLNEVPFTKSVQRKVSIPNDASQVGSTSDPFWLSSSVSTEHHDCPLVTTNAPLSITFLCEGFAQTCESQLKFAFSLLVLSSHYHLSPTTTEFVSLQMESVSCANVISRLTRLTNGFRLLRWLSCMRMHRVPDQIKTIKVWEHLNLLGMSRLSQTCSSDGSTLAVQTTLPAGLTLIEQLCCGWRSLCTFLCSSQVSAAQIPHMSRLVALLSSLHIILNPNEHFGRGLLRVFHHLLMGGHSLELLKMTSYLHPVKHRSFPFGRDDGNCDTQMFVRSESGSWDGDCSVLFLCTGLAHLWLGYPELAEEDFTRASDWLWFFTQSSLSTHSGNVSSLLPFKTKRMEMRDLLLCSLLPGEFSCSQLFCVNDELANLENHRLCPEEVQVRFLMKVMPVLETGDCVIQALNLCEFALNILAKVHLSFAPVFDESCKPDNGDAHQDCLMKSRRLSSLLASLRAFNDSPNAGFLCDPLPDTDITGGTHSLLYVHLIDLEAALWTRMFKHHLALGNYALAHLLIRSNPDLARRRDCLRQLIVTLCDRQEAAQLVSFHYGASEDEFLLILEARARATDVLPTTFPLSTEEPFSIVNPYYDVLYAFHIRRANYRAAAMVLFEHAHRLAEEAACSLSSLYGSGFRAGGARLLFGLQRQAACLVSAINVLFLVPEEHQWLVRPGTCSTTEGYSLHGRPSVVNKGEDQSNVKTGLDALVEDDWAFEDTDDQSSSLADCETVNSGLQSNNAIITDENNEEISPTLNESRLAQTKQILQLDDLMRMYTLTRARLRIAQACWEQGMLRAGPASPVETVQCLLSLAIYDEAIQISEQFDLDFVPILHAVASRCTELAQYASDHPPDARIDSALSIISRAPCLPGLSSVSNSLLHEADLVVQSLYTLAGTSSRSSNQTLSHTDTIDPSQIAVSTTRNLSLSDLYWRLLETLLSRLDSPSPTPHKTGGPAPGQLHLLACHHILSSEPNQLHIPEWLASRLRCASFRTYRPTGLLRLYLQHDRIQSAYSLAMDMLDAAQGVRADPMALGLRTTLNTNLAETVLRKESKSIAQSLWLPHSLLVRLLEALRVLGPDFPACTTMHHNLSKNMYNYFIRLDATCANLAALHLVH